MITYEYSDEGTHFLQLRLGGDRNFCYLLGERRSGSAAAVDPGFKAEQLAAAAAERGLDIRMILLTHAHSDHMAQAGKLARLTKAPRYAGKGEKVPKALIVGDGDRLALGEKSILVYHTPGHSPGHLCYLFENRLITGDLLFCGKVGGTGHHFPGSSPEAEWDSLQQILGLPDEVGVFPGHDYYGGEGNRLHSTIGYEKQHNPFLQCRSFEAFCHLKDTWDLYKATHGIR
jgi:glyoxylase-like metal-dependent hydrolase (beta-lactamase superfamily II)